ncbi:GlcG/HbpS family heme-binding protein [Luteithermobacter gelatinilyticus]|uniref:GlcG/HbpS family heme-binding protein n=1 Tax=Luteithermobacter gelatinilyticus TaxID=2582913 RepID=UPI0011073B5A|nr:heme-binding protein [Luteithermobacter gelatinilyticus]|tara:strand:+ start:215 stop:685 length:471 start_codon:yes stop_codon:yes gene_type:complete
MITKKVLSLAEAEFLLDAAQKASEKFGGKHVICIADDTGYPIALRRLDNAKVTGVQIAENKAFTAAAHRRVTHTFTNTYPGEEAWGIFTQHGGRITVFVGGYPIYVDGAVVGGIGVSGGNGEEDIAVCEAAIEAFKEYMKETGGGEVTIPEQAQKA